jgi:hypothetical protein
MTPPRSGVEQAFQNRVSEIIDSEGSPRQLLALAGELETLRSEFPTHAKAIDKALMTTLAELRKGIKQAAKAQDALKAELEILTNPPWRVARVRAIVQEQNAPFFERLHWHALGQVECHGLPHMRMEADLRYYSVKSDPVWEL